MGEDEYLLQEDNLFRFELEDQSGFILLEEGIGAAVWVEQPAATGVWVEQP